MIHAYELGKKLIDHDRWINYRRVWVFAIRAWWNHKEVERIDTFFSKNPLRRQIMDRVPDLYIQLLRQVLYKGATVAERCEIIINHFQALEEMFEESLLHQIYINGEEFELWHDCLQDQQYSIAVLFRVNEIREGLLTLNFTRNGIGIYHMNFSLCRDNDGQWQILIGALQGYQGAGPIYKEMTKAFFGYRPKNLILFAMRMFAQKLGVGKIRAVSNYGF